jgi:3-hydroxyisobutyrate dehydrogenase-like beta-hydroxyacid dehydrogenase
LKESAVAETIGWIGLGSIGHRMVRHLAGAGHPLLVADIANASNAPQGARIAASNGEVAAGADIVILSLPNGRITETVAREIVAAKGRRARTVIETSTIGIAAAETAARILREADIDLIDAPVSGGIAYDKFPRRILTERYDAGFTTTLQAKDVRLYLENARAAGIADEIASVIDAVWSKMDADMPGADITRMYPYTKGGRGNKGRDS